MKLFRWSSKGREVDPFLLREHERIGVAINRLQDARSVALAGALALVGTVVVAGVNDALGSAPSEGRSLRVTVLVLFGCLVVIVSTLLTGYFSRGVHRLSTDLRERVEPSAAKGGLETRLSQGRGKAANGSPISRWGASHTFSAIYLVTVVFLAALVAFAVDWKQTAHMWVVVPGLMAAAILSLDLGLRFLPFWIK